MNICIIPARGGSKRIPKKNIKLFKNKPMIEWSIEAARRAEIFHRIVVSTDCEEVKEVAIKAGAEVPFKRPDELSNDIIGTKAVIQHAISKITNDDNDKINICCVYATAPFIQEKDLREGRQLLEYSEEGTVVLGVTTYPYPIQRSLMLDSQNYTTIYNQDGASKRSQDLIEMYHDAGQFYWAKKRTWYSKNNLFKTGRGLVLPRWRVQDIDTEEDWKYAELIHETLSKVEKGEKG